MFGSTARRNGVFIGPELGGGVDDPGSAGSRLRAGEAGTSPGDEASDGPGTASRADRQMPGNRTSLRGGDHRGETPVHGASPRGRAWGPQLLIVLSTLAALAGDAAAEDKSPPLRS